MLLEVMEKAHPHMKLCCAGKVVDWIFLVILQNIISNSRYILGPYILGAALV